MITSPGYGKHNYVLFEIDASEFTNGGTITINITGGTGTSKASFDLFPHEGEIPTQGRPEPFSLVHSYDVPPGQEATLTHNFSSAQIFKLGAEGNWFSDIGSTNTFQFTATITSH